MKYVEAPEIFNKTYDLKAVFLAGGITNCPDWQSEIVNLLESYDLVFLNPRRKVFSGHDARSSREQIRWEFEHLRKADAILFWFPMESLCPIALYELGAWCMTETPLFVGVHPDYERRLDVEEQTTLVRPRIEIVYSLDALSKQIIRYLQG